MSFKYFPLFLLIYEFTAYLSNDMYLPALLAMESDFATTTKMAESTITVWYLGIALPQLIMGPLADRFGRRLVLLTGAVLFLASTIGCALTHSIELFLLYRFMQGAAVCSLLVSGYATIHETYDNEKAIHIIAWMGCITIVAPMAGPLLGSFILLSFSWRDIFWCIFAGSLSGIIGLFYVMPKSAANPRDLISWKALKQSYGELFKTPDFRNSTLMLSLFVAVLISWIAASPFLLMQEEKLDPVQFAWLQVPIFASYALATRFVTPLLSRLGQDCLRKLGLGIIGFSMLMLFVGNAIGLGYLFTLIVPLSIYSLGFGLISALLNRESFMATEVSKGTVSSLFYLCVEGVGGVASLLLGLIDYWMLALGLVAGAFLLHQKRRIMYPSTPNQKL